MRNNKSKTKIKAFNFQHRVNKHVNLKTSTTLSTAQVSSKASYSDEEGNENDDNEEIKLMRTTMGMTKKRSLKLQKDIKENA